MIRNLICLLVSMSIAAPTEIAAAEQLMANSNVLSRDLPDTGSTLTEMPDLELSATFDIDQARETAFSVADQYGTASFYIDDLIDRLDFEPMAAFEYIRDRIALDPYQGSLRGASGVLGAGAGNALDRAVLLQRLISGMGYDARLVFGDLSGDGLSRLAGRSLEIKTPYDIEPLGALGGFVPGMMQRLVDRARRDYRWLSGAVPPDTLSQSYVPDVRDRLTNHVWVQAKLDDGWVDMDPSFADSEVGERYAEVRAYHNEMPDHLRQKVRIRIVAEYLDSGKLAEEVSLERELEAEVAAASQVYLGFQPTSGGLGDALANKLGAQPSFRPVLIVDDEEEAGNALPLISNPLDDAEQFLFGRSSEKELTALYLDVETVIPEANGTSRRRPLLDRLPAAVRAGDTVGFSDIQEVEKANDAPTAFQSIHQIVTSHGGSNPYQIANDVGLAIYFVGKYFGDEEALNRMSLDAMMWPAAMLRRIPVAVSEHVSVRALNDREDLRFYIGEPRVFVFSLSASGDATDFPFEVSVDLLLDKVHVTSAVDTRSSAIATRQMRYGVMQGAFETTYLETIILASGVRGNLSSASELSTRKPVVYSDPGDVEAPENVPYALLQDLRSGKQVVAAMPGNGEPTQVWWSIDRSGETRAMLAPGLGGSKWWSTWNNYTRINPYAKVTPTGIPITPDMTGEQLRNYLKLKEAHDKADKKYEHNGKHAARTKQAGRTPRIQRQSGGGTEYAMVQEVALAMLEFNVVYFGLVLTAIVVAAFMVMFAFVAIYNKSQGRDWDYNTPFGSK